MALRRWVGVLLLVCCGAPTVACAQVSISTLSDSLVRRLLVAHFGKVSITPPDTIYIVPHTGAPTKNGVGNIDTTWAGSTVKSVLAMPNTAAGWSPPYYVSGNRYCDSSLIKVGGIDPVVTSPRTFTWVSLWADRGLTVPLAVVLLPAPITVPVGRRWSLAIGALKPCGGYP